GDPVWTGPAVVHAVIEPAARDRRNGYRRRPARRARRRGARAVYGLSDSSRMRDRNRRRNSSPGSAARRAVRRMDGLLLRRHAGAALRQREDDPPPQRSDPHLRAAAQARRRNRPAQGYRRGGADLARARRLRRARGVGRVEPRSRARDPLHRDPDSPALSRSRAPGAAHRVFVPGRRLRRQVDGGGRRGYRCRRSRSGAVGDVHAVRSAHRHRHDSKGLGLQARSAFSARQLQQPHSDRCLHPLCQEAERNVPRHGRCQRRSAQALAVEISATVSQALSAMAMRLIRRVSMCAMCAVAAALAATLATQGARSAGVEDFYRGKTVSLLIGYSMGGGYDAYGRLLARHFGKHLPGNPNVVPQNMSGAGSLKAANYLYSVAPKDGSVIGTFSRSQGIAPLLDKAEFDSTKFTWLGSVTDEVSLCVTRYDAPVKTFSELLVTPATFGGEGAGSDPNIFALLYRNVFGAKIKIVTGYPGTNEIQLATERGEVDGLCGLSWSTLKGRYPHWLKDKKANILVQAGIKKQPELPDVPSASELAKQADQRQILQLMLIGQAMARPFAAPPGIPADRKAALIAAFERTTKD